MTIFIDDLAFLLFAISFAGFLELYTVIAGYFAWAQGPKQFAAHLQSAGAPMLIVGAYLFIAGLWGQFTWPLPGSYNILFYDPAIAFGMVLLAFGWLLRTKGKLEYAGILGLMVGVMAIIYGTQGYGLGLTTVPEGLLALYFLYGMAGIFIYPVSLAADRQTGRAGSYWAGWGYLVVIFMIFVLLAALTSAYVGASAITSNLNIAP